MRGLLLCVFVAGCSALPIFTPQPDAGPTVRVISATACTPELVAAGDLVETSQPEPGVFEARLIRDGGVFAWGRSRVSGAAAVDVVVRRAGAFTPVCGALIRPRAGHRATQLQDGRVFVSGGFVSDGAGPVALVQTELLDVGAGTFTPGPVMAIGGGTQLPRAFHTSSLLPNGQVLLHGGERYASSAMVSPQRSTLVFDAAVGAFGAVPSRQNPPNVARTRHLALVMPAGAVIAGGFTGSTLDPVREIEFFDAAVNRLDVLGTTAGPAVTAAAWVAARGVAALIEGQAIELANPAMPGVSSESARLTLARAQAHALARGTEVLVAGEGTSEVVDLATHAVSAGPAVPGDDGCMVELGGDRWLFVGRTKTSLLSWRGGYAVTAIDHVPGDRSLASCAALEHGLALVSGGQGADGGVLGDAYVFTPPLP